MRTIMGLIVVTIATALTLIPWPDGHTALSADELSQLAGANGNNREIPGQLRDCSEFQNLQAGTIPLSVCLNYPSSAGSPCATCLNDLGLPILLPYVAPFGDGRKQDPAEEPEDCGENLFAGICSSFGGGRNCVSLTFIGDCAGTIDLYLDQAEGGTGPGGD